MPITLARKLLLTMSGGRKPSYSSILVDDYSMSEIYPLVDIASGTTINAAVSAANNGTLAGWALQNTAGPVTGTLAPLFDGTNAYGNIGAMSAIWNGAIGFLTIFAKVSAAGVWTDGATRHIFKHQFNGSNRIYAVRASVNGRLQVFVSIGGVTVAKTLDGLSTTDWFAHHITNSL